MKRDDPKSVSHMVAYHWIKVLDRFLSFFFFFFFSFFIFHFSFFIFHFSFIFFSFFIFYFLFFFVCFFHSLFLLLFFSVLFVLLNTSQNSYDPNAQPPFELLRKAVVALTGAGEMSARQYSIREVFFFLFFFLFILKKGGAEKERK